MKDKKFIVTIALIIVTLVVSIGSMVNTSLKYNDGFCTNCYTRYEEKHYVYDGKEWIDYTCKGCGESGSVLAMVA